MYHSHACVAAAFGGITGTTAEHKLLQSSAPLLSCDPLADWLVGLEVLQLALPAAVARSPASAVGAPRQQLCKKFYLIMWRLVVS
jgi:hypothetical protein